MEKIKKGQAAIEFLVTYGWAIMAALLVIGALSYFGITSPASSLPDKCVFSSGFECQEFIFNTSMLKLRMINTQGETIYKASAVFTEINNSASNCWIQFNNQDWYPEQVREINCSVVPGGPYSKKDRIKTKITINYAKTPTGYNQIANGEIYGTVQ